MPYPPTVAGANAPYQSISAVGVVNNPFNALLTSEMAPMLIFFFIKLYLKKLNINFDVKHRGSTPYTFSSRKKFDERQPY